MAAILSLVCGMDLFWTSRTLTQTNYGTVLFIRVSQTMPSFPGDYTRTWNADWGWGATLIVLTVIIHVLCLGFINLMAIRISRQLWCRFRPRTMFVMVVGATTLLATSLHGFEAIIWAAAYRRLNALPDVNAAMLYSLSAITTYGHENLTLESRWQLLGALEALNGWLLFGLTTAFLFGIIRRVWKQSEAR